MNIENLIRALGNPREDEFGREQHLAAHRGEPWASMDRLEALAELKWLADAGRMPAPQTRRGTNTHVHTRESFSILRSPSDAAWQGFQAGLDVLGINDHYTIGGHDEFREACRIVGLRATFSMEAVAVDAGLLAEGVRCNDPGNPGRTYLSAKGIVYPLAPDSQGHRDLEMMKNALRRRNEQIVEKLNALLARLEPALRLSFEDDVLALTPRGNTTERHVCQALAELIERSIPDRAARVDFLRRLVGADPRPLRSHVSRPGQAQGPAPASDVPFDEQKDLASDAAYQNMLRATLLKAGRPAYAEESPEAFISWERMISMYLEYGSIPSYPVLGNPVVELEDDLEKLFDAIAGRKLHAIEVIPHRNTHERLAAILDAAARHGYPVFNGTEHNTKTPMPLLDKWSGSDEFIGQFTLGANVLIGHQVLSSCAGLGYVDSYGDLSVPDREHGLSLFSFAGRMVQKPETMLLLKKLGRRGSLSLLAGLHKLMGSSTGTGLWSIASRAKITAKQLAGVKVKLGKAEFASIQAADGLGNWAEENVM